MSRTGSLRRPMAASLVMGLATLSGVVLWAPPAAATQEQFTYTGAAQTFIVPAGVTTLALTLVGAPGGAGSVSGTGGAGANGAMVVADLTVAPGDTLSVLVGGVGSDSGGFNGGGGPATATTIAGGGGGATDVRINGSALANRALVAGGGGGGGASGTGTISEVPGGAGGAGGATAGNGANGASSSGKGGGGGRAGTGSAGGAGGTPGTGYPPAATGSSGSSGTGGGGGIATSNQSGGGGGGGGYFGGGGGGTGAGVFTAPVGGGGGGAGSSFSAGLGAGVSNFSVSTSSTAVPMVTITYAGPPSITAISPPDGTESGGTSVTITGAGFTGVTAVNFGAVPSTSVTVHGATSITAIAPAQDPGAVHVTVVSADGTSPTSSADLFTYKVSTVAGLTVSDDSPAFGEPITLTSALSPGAPTGTVTFYDVPAKGPQATQTVTLGTATIGAAEAELTVTLPSLGLHTITAHYNGDAGHLVRDSADLAVEARATVGELIVRQFRLSGPGGGGNQFIELYNTGVPLPLAGFSVLGSGESLDLLDDAPILATGGSYLIGGQYYNLTGGPAPDATMTFELADGVRIQAPDTAGTVTDAAGVSAGYHTGTALPTFSGIPSQQYAWTRRSVAGVPQNTGDNLADFALVSTTGGLVGGVQSSLGAPNPASATSPTQHNATLQSALLDSTASSSVEPNRTVSAGTLTVRRTITNSSPDPVNGMRLVITSLSQVDGLPRPGAQPAARAYLRVVDPEFETSQVTVTGQGLVTVQNLSAGLPTVVPPGGGPGTTLPVPLPICGLAPDESVNVSVTFAVDRAGTYWVGYDVQAFDGFGVSRCAARLGNRPAFGRAAHHPGPMAAGDSGELRQALSRAGASGLSAARTRSGREPDGTTKPLIDGGFAAACNHWRRATRAAAPTAADSTAAVSRSRSGRRSAMAPASGPSTVVIVST